MSLPTGRPARPFRRVGIGEEAFAGTVDAPVGFACGVAMLVSGLGAIVAASVSLTDGRRDLGPLLTCGIVFVAVGATITRTCRVPVRIPAGTSFVGVVVMWFTFIAGAAVVYVATGVFDRLDDALFEATAGYTTTALTVIGDPEELSHGVLFWRALTQWIGGLCSLLVVVAILPSLGVGGLEVTRPGATRQAAISRRNQRLMVNLISVYAVLTAVGILLYLLAGMGPFDSVTYAFTTISSGGFGNHAGSFEHFESALIEWAGVGGMVLAGANLALLFRGLRGQLSTTVLRSTELRAYAVLIAGGSAIAILFNAGDDGWTHETVRHSVFSITSAISTTGHFVANWGTWDVGVQVLLLALMGIGAMSGSSGSGFRIVRALALFGYVRREVRSELNPRAVIPVRVGRTTLDDGLVSRLIGYQVQWLLVAGLGALALGLTGADLLSAMSGSVSAIANVGPALGVLSPFGGGATLLTQPARVALIPVMLLGRLEVAPIMIGIAVVGARTARVLRDTRRRVTEPY